MPRNKIGLVIFLVLFTLIIAAMNSVIVFAPTNEQACCINPEVPSFCLDEKAYPGTQNPYADITDCCFGDQSCASKFLRKGTSCNSLDECKTGAITGCCTDECTAGTQSTCKDSSSFSAVSCDNVAKCSTGCCLCTENDNQKIAFNLITEPECKSDCQDRGYGTYDFNPQQQDCRIGTKLAGKTVKGRVTDTSGVPLEKATVILEGIAQYETLPDGKFEIADVPPKADPYKIKVIKSRYLSNFTSFTLVSTDAEKIINFELGRASFGTISGIITEDGDQLKPVPNAVISVSGIGQDTTYLSDEKGEYSLLFHLAGQPIDYIIQVSAQGYVSKSEIVTLPSSMGKNDVLQDFRLPRKKPGILRVVVKEIKGNIEIGVVGAKVTLNTGLQRFTLSDGSVVFGGADRFSDNLFEGNYTVDVFKGNYLSNRTTDFDVKPWFENVLKVILAKDNDLCHMQGSTRPLIFEEYIRNGTCSQLNKPYYCQNGDLANNLNEVVYTRCQGRDNIPGTVDDCCPANEECQSTGYCLPKDTECTSSCTYKNSLVCRSECNGLAGCTFPNDVVNRSCNGKLSGIDMIQYGVDAEGLPMNVICCNNWPPRTSKKEDCTNNADDDGDTKKDCEDEDCYQKQCHSTNKNKICQTYNFGDDKGKLGECRAKPCTSGEITADNAGCLCNGVETIEGNFCCDLDNNDINHGRYTTNAENDFINSPCGNTPCRLAQPRQGTCCRACKETTTPGSLLRLGENACNALGIKCCLQCDITPEDVCEYRSLCPAIFDTIETDPTKTTNVRCAGKCNKVQECVANKPIYDFTYNSPLCRCGERTFLVPSSDAFNNNCCRDTADGPLYVTRQNCLGAPELGKITGYVKKSPDLTPIKDATICSSPTNCYETTDENGKFEIRVPFGAQRSYYATKKGFKDYTVLSKNPNTASSITGNQLKQSVIISKPPTSGASSTSVPSSSAAALPPNILEQDLTLGTIKLTDFVLEQDIDICTEVLPPVKNFTVNHTLGEVKKIKLKWGVPIECINNIMGYRITRTLVPIVPSTGSGSSTSSSTLSGSAQPVELPFVPRTKDGYLDIDVNYDTTYSYEIKVQYLGKEQLSEANTSRIRVGELKCEGMFRNNQPVQFCALNVNNKLVDKRVCNTQNRVIEQVIESCDPNTQVCSGPNVAGLAICKNLSQCSTRKQNAFPFGLYFEKEKCLGTDSLGNVDYSNNCFFDYYKSDEADPNKIYDVVERFGTEVINHQVTPFDKCLSCPVSQASKMSCFNYRSEYACTTDNCNRGNGACSWINASFSEFGLGYCYAENYTGSDNCDMCSESNDVFFNTRCSQKLCSKLGRCFAAEQEAACKKCSEARCEDLKTQELCVSGSADGEIKIGRDAIINYSKDACSLGRCKWQADKCIKDGNANDVDDCDVVELRNIDPDSGRLLEACKHDNNATVTKLDRPRALSLINRQTQDLFFAVESNEQNAYTFSYCIDKQDKAIKCYPGANTLGGGEIAYGGKKEVKLQVEDIIRSLEKQGYDNPDLDYSDTYYIRFFSTDKFYNQEDVKILPVYIDIWAPKLTSSIIKNINMEGTPVNKDTKSQLLFTISSNEDVHCNFEDLRIKGIGSIDASKTIRILTKNDKDEDLYDDEFNSQYVVKDGLYSYRVTCHDKSFNSAEILYDGDTAVHIDAFGDITVLEPVTKRVFNDNNVFFKVKTTDSSICKLASLPSGNTLTGADAEFKSTDKLIHTLTYPVTVLNTDRVSGTDFKSQHYPDISGSGYGVKCTSILGELEDLEAFEFTVDTTPPNITLVIASNQIGGQLNFDKVNDDQFFKEYGDTIGLSILCQDTQIQGSAQVFGAKPSSEKICMTEDITGCDNLQRDKFVSITSVGSIQETQHLCFTCEDKGGNIAPVKCGDIIVDKQGPQFIFTVYDDSVTANTAVKILKRQPLNSKFYRAEVISTENLTGDAVLLFRIKRYDKDGFIEYAPTIKIQKKLNQLANPLRVVYEGSFAVPLAEEFNNLDNRDTVQIVIIGKDKFNNHGRLAQNYTFDTTSPKAPLFNQYENTATRYAGQGIFDQTGFEADKVANRNIIIERGNRPNIVRVKTLNVRGVTMNTLQEVGVSRAQNLVQQTQDQSQPSQPLQTTTSLPQTTTAQPQTSLSRKSFSTYSTPDPVLRKRIKLDALLEGDKLKLKDAADLDLTKYYLEFPDIKLPTKRFYKIEKVLDGTEVDTIKQRIVNRLTLKQSHLAAQATNKAANSADNKNKGRNDDDDNNDRDNKGNSNANNDHDNNNNRNIVSSTGRVVLNLITGNAAGDATTNSDTLTSSTTTGFILSSPSLTAVEQQDPNSKFINIGRTLYGLETVKEEDLDTQSQYKKDLVVNVYERAEPLGWFNANMDLPEGSTWFYAYAIDENNNLGLPTGVKKVIKDTKAPEILHYGPSENSKISANLGVNVFATFTDLNSGVKRETAVLEIDGKRHTCDDPDDPVVCIGTKTFTISITLPLKQQGQYTAKASVSDVLGNSPQPFVWNFVINNDAPSNIRSEALAGACIQNDKCYVNNTKPEFKLQYDALPEVNITAEFKSDIITALIQKINDFFNIQPAQELTEGQHSIDVMHKNSITSAEYPNFVKFVVDTTYPDVSIDSIAPTSSKSINITGNYTEDNVYEIRFSGDIKQTEPMTYRELPTDLLTDDAGKSQYLFIKNVELDISNASKPGKEVKITIIDKANNAKEITLSVYYDVIPPNFENVTVKTIAAGKKIFATEGKNETAYKTNDVNVKISGKSTKSLYSMMLATEYITKVVNIDSTGLNFDVDLELINTLSQTKEEHVLLQAEDDAGNKQFYFMLVELDIHKPEVEIKII